MASVLLLLGCQPEALYAVPATLTAPYNDDFTVKTYEELLAALASSYVRVHVFDVLKPARGAALRATVNGGSGTIVDPRGYVVTMAHIAKDLRFLAEVTSVDGRIHAGRVVAVSPGQDLALIKIKPFSGIQSARIADGRRLATGDTVIGIGTPYGRMAVATIGRVLETRRRTRIKYAGYGYDDAIVLQMAVEPGHSGSPLFDETGELVGLLASFGLADTNRKPYVPTEIAFAIPSNKISAYLRSHLPP